MSISETLATDFLAGGGVAGLAGTGVFAAAGGWARGAGLGSASLFFGATLPLDAAVLVAGAVFRAAGFAAVLLVGFDAICWLV